MPFSSSNFATAVPGLTVTKDNLVYPQAMNAKPMSLRRRDGAIKRSRIELTHPTPLPTLTTSDAETSSED